MHLFAEEISTNLFPLKPGADGRPQFPNPFEFLRRLTLHPGEIADADVTRLRARGWRDEQIFEAAFDVSLFNFFNRMAATYSLEAPPDGWQPHLASASPAPPAAPQAAAQ